MSLVMLQFKLSSSVHIACESCSSDLPALYPTCVALFRYFKTTTIFFMEYGALSLLLRIGYLHVSLVVLSPTLK
jgi:hypothetical protein